MAARMFDLNVEKVLEHWTVAHAVREVIANALDEQALTNGPEPTITKDERGCWHIRDEGRGLRYQHLTQNENQEKLERPQLVIGKFGVGLKDALATFHRHNIGITIRSRHGTITVEQAHKHGFEDITTLHALVDDTPLGPPIRGTDVALDGVIDDDIETAKGFFLRYSGDSILEQTPVGEVLQRGTQEARIYVNGLRIAEEADFLFSYNITATTTALRRALNRERSNVGRTAYTDRVKAILLACRSAAVADALTRDLEAFQTGGMHDELQWADVALHACKVLNAAQRVIFLTAGELTEARQFVDYARGDGHRIVVVPDTIRQKLPTLRDLSGEPLRDLTLYRQEWNESFHYTFVPVEQLSPAERAIWDKTWAIIRLAGGRPKNVREVLVSETMRLQSQGYGEAVGVWESGEQRIIIKRSQLATLAAYAGTLLHELTHARSGHTDLTLAFEDALTQSLGTVAAHGLTEFNRTRPE